MTGRWEATKKEGGGIGCTEAEAVTIFIERAGWDVRARAGLGLLGLSRVMQHFTPWSDGIGSDLTSSF